jgi:hypothetical protein
LLPTRNGVYNINIYLNDVSVKGSPFSINVKSLNNEGNIVEKRDDSALVPSLSSSKIAASRIIDNLRSEISEIISNSMNTTEKIKTTVTTTTTTTESAAIKDTFLLSNNTDVHTELFANNSELIAGKNVKLNGNYKLNKVSISFNSNFD